MVESPKIHIRTRMAKLPTVAIIGKPNTGKSTLFNRMIGRRKAIVSDIPGTTRDQIASMVSTDELDFLLIDTGGMGGGTQDKEMEDDVHRQSLLALESADLILFTIDSRQELTANDFEIATLLRKRSKKHISLIIVPTKCDNPATIDEVLARYFKLGLTDIITPVSAPHGIGIPELQDHIVQELKALHFTKDPLPEDRAPRIAIIGKPNVGKSSLVNAFMSEVQREKSPLLVSDIAGTTRDATDTVIRYHEKDYVFVDTAGIKRQSKTNRDIETFAYLRSIQAIQECDITVLVLDATEPVSKQDKRIAGMAVDEGKGLIILLNKADALTAEEKKTAVSHAKILLEFCKFAPILPCSAKTRDGLLKLFDLIEAVQGNRTRRIADKELHRWFEDSVHGQPMSALAKTKHITQASEVPPTFILFVKNPKQVQVSQLRFLDNAIRRTFAFEGTPIRWVTKGKDSE